MECVQKAVCDWAADTRNALLVLAPGLGTHYAIQHWISLHPPSALALILNCCCTSSSSAAAAAADLASIDSRIHHVHSATLTSTAHRHKLYRQGGIYLVSSRLLLMDMLTQRLSSSDICSLLLLLGTDQVRHGSIEHFIISLYSSSSTTITTTTPSMMMRPWIRAISSNPGALTSPSLEHNLRILGCRSVHLLPRFHMELQLELDAKLHPQSRSFLDVEEWQVPMASGLKQVHHGLLAIMDKTLKHLLQHLTTTAPTVDEHVISLESVLSKHFERHLNALLLYSSSSPNKTTHHPSVTALIKELKIQRALLQQSIYHPASTFHSNFESILLEHFDQIKHTLSIPSGRLSWVEWDETQALFELSKRRVYQVIRRSQAHRHDQHTHSLEVKCVLEQDEKYKALRECLNTVHTIHTVHHHVEQHGGTKRVLVMVDHDRTRRALSDYLGLITPTSSPTLNSVDQWMYYSSQRAKVTAEMAVEEQWTRFVRFNKRVQTLLRQSTTTTPATTTTDTAPTAAGSSSSETYTRGGGAMRGGHKRRRVRGGSVTAASASATVAVGNKGASAALMSLDDLEALIRVRDEFNPTQPTVTTDGPIPTQTHIEAGQDIGETDDHVVPGELKVMVRVYEPDEKGSDDDMLKRTSPTHVILFNMSDPSFIRRLELFQSQRVAREETVLKIYILMYEDSVEEQTYLTEIRSEKQAFERLIRQKATMKIQGDISRTNPLLSSSSSSSSTAAAAAAAAGVDMDLMAQTSTLNQQREGTIIIDLREFRSRLPFTLHSLFTILPIQVEVGDYILSPQCCIERKSISDLVGSLGSGRIVKQVEAMQRYYGYFGVLIEFGGVARSERATSSLFGVYVSSSSLLAQQTLVSSMTGGGRGHVNQPGGNGHSHTVQSKLIALSLKFPKLKLMWSTSDVATSDMFMDLKKKFNRVDPDPEVVSQVGIGLCFRDSTEEGGDEEFLEDGLITPRPLTSASGRENGEFGVKELAVEVLKRLPGLDGVSYKWILKEVKNFQELMGLSEERIVEIIGNSERAARLYRFLHAKV